MYENNFRLEGMIHERFDAVQVTETFRKREFILQVTRPGDSNNIDFIKFQCLQNRISLLDEIRVGNRVIVAFMVTGREWSNAEGKRYFTNLDCTDIDVLDPTSTEKDTPASFLAKDIQTTIIPEAGFPQTESRTGSGEDWLTGSTKKEKDQFDPGEFDDLPFQY